MEKISFKPIDSEERIYSDQFSKKGWFIIDKIELRPNNPITDKRLIAVIDAHFCEDPSFKVRATSDKFNF